MEVKFDLVRIGKIRKSSIAETILKQNIQLLKNNVRLLLKEESTENNKNQSSIEMVIPGKGYSIKIVLRNIKDEKIKRELRRNFPNAIYKGEYSVIIDNINNKVWGL